MITMFLINRGSRKRAKRRKGASRMTSRTSTSAVLTENNIHNWVGEAQFNRGMQYVNEGLIVPRSVHGNVVRGWCLPRAGLPGLYYVWVRLRGLRVGDAHCTCALGKYGICPHVAAVLVGYVRSPKSFQRSFWQRMKSWFGGRTRVQLPPQLSPESVPERTAQVA
jgi:uncharacterized Zn finger protein